MHAYGAPHMAHLGFQRLRTALEAHNQLLLALPGANEGKTTDTGSQDESLTRVPRSRQCSARPAGTPPACLVVIILRAAAGRGCGARRGCHTSGPPMGGREAQPGRGVVVAGGQPRWGKGEVERKGGRLHARGGGGGGGAHLNRRWAMRFFSFVDGLIPPAARGPPERGGLGEPLR